MSSQNDVVGRLKNNWRQRACESTTFRAELRVIPRWLIKVLFVLYVVALAIVFYAIFAAPGNFTRPVPGESMALNGLVMFGIVTAGAIAVSAFVMLIGYIGCDAKRRGMSPVLWVLVAILVPYLIGAILYFVVREPLPFNCPQCGRTVNAQFNFCPACQFNLRPNCPECRRAIHPDDRFCPHCGFTLPSDTPAPADSQKV
jgi:RNA polymerase subunit RPABC4/transcription elongation factor Spt4